MTSPFSIPPSAQLNRTLYRKILKYYWGYDDFRPLQEDIIDSVVTGHDTLGLMPTGGGKSITFQVAGIALGGLTIVVTPLISLIKDQVDNLNARKIRAVAFHSGLTRHEFNIAWEKLTNGKAKFLYIAPERIADKRFLSELKTLNVCQIVVDEAHCISQWGYDFRPSYLNIAKIRRNLPNTPILALTATATPKVADDICNCLEFNNPNRFSKSFVRNNLNYIVRSADTKIQELLNILSKTSGSAIVYVRSRRRTREIAEFLTESGISSTYYHAGLESSVKESRQNDWVSGKIRTMVATNAFGMGIDKSDVRVVIHFDIPPSLEEYYQEAGRAGRDGQTSYAVLLSSPIDKSILKRRLTNSFPSRDFIRKTYERACIFMDLAVGEGYDTVHEFDIERFCANFKLNTTQCLSAFRILAHAGYLEYNDKAENRSRVIALMDRHEFYNLYNLSDNATNVLNAVMRTCPGLFADYVAVNETKLSMQTNLSPQTVYDALLELNRAGALNYIPKSSVPIMYVPTSREETRHIIIGKDVYENRMEDMRLRIDAIIDYVFNSDGCRVERMLNYFGEENGAKCGKCDVCRNERKQNHNCDKAIETSEIDESIVAEKIIEILSSRSHGLRLVMIQSLIHFDDNLIAQTLSFLCSEGILSKRNDMFFLNS